MMMGQRAAASARRIYEVLDEQPDDRRPARRRRPRRVARRRRTSTTSTSRTPTARRCSSTSTCTCARARRSRSSAAPAPGSPRWPGCSRASTTSPTARSAIDGKTCATSRCSSLRHQIGHGARRSVPVLGVDPRQHRVRPARRALRGDRGRGASPPVPTTSSATCPRATTPWSASVGYTLSGGQRQRISIAAHAAREPADPHPRRRDHARSTCRSSSRSTCALTQAHAGPDHAHHRPPAVDHQPRRPGGRGRGRSRHRGRHAHTNCWPPSRATWRSWPRPKRRKRTRSSRTTTRSTGNGCSSTRSTSTSPTRACSTKRSASRARPTPPEDRLMAWGGAGGGMFGGGAPVGGGSPGNPGNGLPFAGIPRSCRRGVEKLLDDRARLAHARARSSRSGSTEKRAHRSAACSVATGSRSSWRACSSWSRRSALQAGPLLSQIGIDDGITPQNWTVLISVAVAAVALRGAHARSPAGGGSR